MASFAVAAQAFTIVAAAPAGNTLSAYIPYTANLVMVVVGASIALAARSQEALAVWEKVLVAGGCISVAVAVALATIP